MLLPTFHDIELAHQRIAPLVHRTPVMTCASINKLTGCDIVFKCENFQKVGAFKYRGATNAVLSLTDNQADRGVCTHSSGNHAAALALAARLRGIKAHIVMPRNAPKIKVEAVEGYGGLITFCEPTLHAREEALEQIVARTGAETIHPYNRFEVICGQGTAAKELIEDAGAFDVVMAPVGGGGLMSGTALSANAMLRNSRPIGAEPLGAADAQQSLCKGRIVPSVSPRTVADGLLTSLGPLTFSVLAQQKVEILTACEASIVAAMRMVWERMKLVIEPSSAVPLAVITEHPERFRGQRVGIILSGGNVDLGRYFDGF